MAKDSFVRQYGTNAKHQTIRHDKAEEYGVWLAATGEHDNHPNLVETGNSLPSVPPSETENSTGGEPFLRCTLSRRDAS